MHPSALGVIALAYHLLSRLAYVLYVGIALKRQEQSGAFTGRAGPEEGFRRFRRMAAVVMNNDALSFILLCVVTQHAPGLPMSRGVAIAAGATLVLVGAATKLWAAVTLGSGAYYWRNFFVPTDPVAPAARGPYRYLRNPMYTVGYLPLYGLALLLGSSLALGAALFDQAAILAFYRLVEKPHFDRHAPFWTDPSAGRRMEIP